MRRFTRLTNAFSKKLENHICALALYFMHYNFARPHKTLANPYPRTPAMAAGITNHIWTIEEIVSLANQGYNERGAVVAQLVEHLPVKLVVVSSSLTCRTAIDKY